MAGNAKNGDLLGVTRIAGIMAAKKTIDLIPQCHPPALTHVAIEFVAALADGTGAEGIFDGETASVSCTATVETIGATGVEIEALLAVNIALLTIYDMCKAAGSG